MANIIIKTDERKANETRILKDFGGNATKERREYAECIAAKSNEALAEMKTRRRYF